MFKRKPAPAYTFEAATADLDGLLARAAEAYLPADRLVDLLESRIAALRARQAASYTFAPAFTRV
jgi:hypothetical protein